MGYLGQEFYPYYFRIKERVIFVSSLSCNREFQQRLETGYIFRLDKWGK